jgi:glycine oxidase
MKNRTDAIVIGGGVIGLAVARQLAMEGLRILLVERRVCGREASWAGAGILSPCNPHRKDVVARWQQRSLNHFPAFCAALHEETGIDPEYDACGEFELLLTNDALSIGRSDVNAAAGRLTSEGRPVYELLTTQQVRALVPCVSERALAAVYCRQSAQVRNPRLIQALVSSCRLQGVSLQEGCEVTGLLVRGGRIEGVETKQGPMHTRRIILAAGSWSSQVEPRLAEWMPVHPVRGQMILLKIPERPFSQVISRGRTYVVPRRDGHLLLGSTEEPEAGYAKRNTARALVWLMSTATELIPGLESASVVAVWSGLRPGTPDDLPFLGPVPGFEGLFAATGHFRAGLTLSPVTAEFVAATVLGRSYDLDLRCCLPGRKWST